MYGGDALGRVDGRVVFAPFALPGERVRVETEREKPGLIHARTVEVLEPSPERIVPKCPYFGRCGGCHYQHASHDYQLNAKRGIVAEELRRVGKFEPPQEIGIVSAEPWGYRNRAQFHIEGRELGYREPGSHRLCAINQCPISSPRINEIIATLNDMLRDVRWPKFIRSVEVFTDESQVQLTVLDSDKPVARRFFEWCAERIPGLVNGPLDYEGRFRVSPNAFFQVNRFLYGQLVETALEGASGETALDLYAGAGLFSIGLASRFGQVVAVEAGTAAVRDLEFNAARLGLAHVRAERCTTEESLRALDRAPEFVLLDPPRAGLGKAVVQRLAELRPPSIVIVACDPATLARDLAGLLAAGYGIDKMTVVDLFPQTYHIETVVRLTLR